MKKDEIKRHKIAAKKLDLVKNRAFGFIKKNLGKIFECDVSDFINSEFKKQGLVTDKNCIVQIIAADKNTAYVHHFPSKREAKIIERDNLILIDIWARLREKNSPFADITWMGYFGKNIPANIKKYFKIVIEARDEAIKFIKKELKQKRMPKGMEVDEIVRSYFKKFGVEKYFFHGTGHSLGFFGCHGKDFHLSQKNRKIVRPNIPFTIEPGLYFKNKFGIRSEIDCYITEDYRLIITTEVQKDIVKI